MGNKIAKEFHETELGRGSLKGTDAEQLISPELVMHGARSTIINEEEIRVGVAGSSGKANRLVARHFINQDNNDMLFQVQYMQKSSGSGSKTADKSTPRSIASDRDGFIIYVDKKIVMPDGQKRTMIYKTSPMYPNQAPTKDEIKVETNSLYLAAVIFDNQAQANQKTATAYLSVVTGRSKSDDTGCKLQDLYKAIKIPKVKNGVLVIDMNGRAVGKAAVIKEKHDGSIISSSAPNCDASFVTSRTTSSSSISCASSIMSSNLDERSTTYEVAPGAEAAAVIAVASSLF
jgi:hypothetical protein